MTLEHVEDFQIVTASNGQIVLRINKPSNIYDTEFSMEFSSILKETNDKIKDSAKNFIKQKFPKLKVATIIILAGTTVLTAFPIHKAEAHEIDFNMTYLYFGDTQSYISQIDETHGNLNLVSPSYFDINADGSLKITKQFDSLFIDEMHERGIKVVPFLSNHWDRNVGRAALQNRELLAQQVADFIMKNNLDGVQIDIENVTEIDRENYTDLVRLLNQKLPAEKEVSVAVAANPNGWTKGWHGSYDYNSLGQYADYLMIMAYDESYSGGPEGPVASYGWVESSIQYALNQGIEPEKIVLGIPFYGRYWKEGASTGGEGISNRRIDELLAKYGGTVTFDEVSKTPKATIIIGEGDTPTTVAGKTLGPGTYHIWYENHDSLQAKFQLLHKYNLKGTGSWSLGQESTSIWPHYSTWLLHDNEIPETPSTTEVQKEQNGIQPLEFQYTVKTGDTLWKIANKFGTTVNQLKVYNNLTSEVIYVGQVLSLIPKTQLETNQENNNEEDTIITEPSQSVESSIIGKEVVPKTSNVYIRRGGTTSYNIVETVNTIDSMKVLDEFTNIFNEKWLRVQTKSNTGWVLASQVELDLTLSATSIIGKRVVPKTSNVYVRRGATTSYSIVETLTTDSMKVLDEFTNTFNEKWLRVQTKNNIGWVLSSQVKSESALDNTRTLGKEVVPKTSNVYVRRGATTSYISVEKLNPTDSMKVLSEFTNAFNEKWLRVQTKKTIGWVLASQVELDTNIIGKEVVPINSNVYVRKGATTSYSMVERLDSIESMKVLDEFTNAFSEKWLRVQTKKNIGWVLASQVERKSNE